MRAFGRDPMPWQVTAAHAIGARNEAGLPRWPFIVITVPRQSGKTTLTGAVAVERCLSSQRAKVWYTAQTGQKARAKWLEVVDDVQSSIFAPIVKVLKTNGAEAIEFPRTRSKFSPHPPTEDSLHSEQSDLNIIDEGWALSEPEAAALMQAITPTQATRPMRQTIVISTVGTAESTWLHGLIDQGLSGDPGIFLIDYGIPHDADPSDLEIVARHHPAFGFTLDMAGLESGYSQLGPAGFARGYGNRRTGSRETLLPEDIWLAAQTTAEMPAEVDAVIGAAIDIDRTETAIAAAAMVDGLPMVEILEVRPGTAWAPPRIEKYQATAAAPPVIDRVGPSSTLAAACERLGLEPRPITPRELCAASAELLDRLTAVSDDGQPAPAIKIRRSAYLDLAMQIVDRRHLGDAWTWSRRGSAGSIAALEAATLALHGLLDRPAPDQKPFIFTGDIDD